MSAIDVIEEHRRAGHEFAAAGVRSFVREEGEGETVVCVHGMWGASFGYRKLVHELARRGLRGVAWDLPGFGLAERPADFNYSWTGLGRFCVAAVEALELDRFHLVVHDIGGPVGFELAAAMPERVRSLTILNTMIDVVDFRPPWPMRPFRVPRLGELWVAGLRPSAFRLLVRRQGIGNPSALSRDEFDAYLRLMKGDDGARAFLRTMRGAERREDKRSLYRSVVGARRYPVQIIWGADDPALPLATYGATARRAAGQQNIFTVRAKHFLQEEQAPAIAERIALLARSPVSDGRVEVSSESGPTQPGGVLAIDTKP